MVHICNLTAATAASRVTANVSQVNLPLLMYYRLKLNFRGLVRMTFGLAKPENWISLHPKLVNTIINK